MFFATQVPANTRAPTLVQRLRKAITELGLASDGTLAEYQLSSPLRVVSALNGIRRFRADRHHRDSLSELDRIFHELAGCVPPAQLLPDRIEAHPRWTGKGCRTRYFVAVPLRGSGDVLLIVRDPALLAKANALLSEADEQDAGRLPIRGVD